jgi:uncharacterized protein
MLEIFNKLKKYNFWSDQAVNLGFRRESYLSTISHYTGNKLVKILVGQRRVGKSYLLRQIISGLLQNGVHPNNTFYLNKEIIHLDEVQNYIQLKELIEIYRKEMSPQGKVYLFIDEVQQIEGWEKTINSYSQDYTDDFEIFITGSNSAMLSGELATLLSGRYIEFRIFPFLFNEYLNYYSLDKNRDHLIKYLKTGGLPELFNLNNDETRSYYISSLKDTIILKDIIQKYHIKDAHLLDKLFRYIVNNTGNLFSVNNITGFFKSNNIRANYDTVANYTNYLKECFLIHEAERYDIRGKEIINGSKKYYLNDLSYRNYLFSGFDQSPGRMLENYIYLFFRQQGYTVYCGKIRNKEIDFILEKNNVTSYVQTTWQLNSDEVIQREFGNLESIPDHYEKLVISMDELQSGNRNGIKHLQAWEL